MESIANIVVPFADKISVDPNTIDRQRYHWYYLPSISQRLWHPLRNSLQRHFVVAAVVVPHIVLAWVAVVVPLVEVRLLGLARPRL